MSACEKGYQFLLALELLREMRQTALEPSVVSYNAAISACEKGRQRQHALELVQELQQWQ